jgi:hypothetical protein
MGKWLRDNGLAEISPPELESAANAEAGRLAAKDKR